jgi:hypothetical protein
MHASTLGVAGPCAPARRSAVGRLVVAALFAGSGMLGAQTVRGRVIDALASLPIPEARLQLVDERGRVLEEARSDSAGWFALTQGRDRGASRSTRCASPKPGVGRARSVSTRTRSP